MTEVSKKDSGVPKQCAAILTIYLVVVVAINLGFEIKEIRNTPRAYNNLAVAYYKEGNRVMAKKYFHLAANYNEIYGTNFQKRPQGVAIEAAKRNIKAIEMFEKSEAWLKQNRKDKNDLRGTSGRN